MWQCPGSRAAGAPIGSQGPLGRLLLRGEHGHDFIDELRPKLASIPGAIAFPLNPPSLGQGFRSTPIEFVIMSQVPYAELQRVVDRFLEVEQWQALYQNKLTTLRAMLYEGGAAVEILQAWTGIIESSALVDEATVAAEADQIAGHFT